MAVAVVLTLAWTLMVLSDVGGIAGYPRGSAKLHDALLGAAGLGTVPVLLIGVLCVAGEFHHQTATGTFLVTPRRSRVLAAKTLACVLAAAPIAILMLAVPLTVGILSGAIEPRFDVHFAGIVARVVLGYGCWALLGVAIGAAIRNQTLAAALPLVWFGVVEQLIPSYGLSWLVAWLPGERAPLYRVPASPACSPSGPRCSSSWRMWRAFYCPVRARSHGATSPDARLTSSPEWRPPWLSCSAPNCLHCAPSGPLGHSRPARSWSRWPVL